MDVTLAQGTFRGAREHGVLTFKGIPYAAPPVGDHRFAPPRRPLPHEGVADATAYGPTVSTPPQRSAVMGELLPDPVRPGANGLNLNVWTPDPEANLPVFVWIHGGGFVTGAGSTTAFDGTAFARDGVVAVTINYRLAAEGFLFLPDAVPNRGLLDQIAALEWVRDNIAAFGGDPDLVTVAGESAGAMAVLTLVTMPRARGLVRRAIAQSGDGHHVHPPEVARLFTSELCAELGVPRSVDGIAGVAVDALHAATNEVITRVSAGHDRRFAEFRRLALQPVIDGEVVPRHPVEAAGDGDTNGIDLMIGTNAEEYGLFCAPTGLADAMDDQLLAATVARLGVDPGTMIERYRSEMPGATPAELFVAIQSDWFCAVPAVRYTDARREAGAASHVYEFAWRPDTYGGKLGACHTLEIPFVFETLDDPWGIALRGPGAPRELAAAVHRAWVDFVTTGDPGWECYGAARRVRRLDLCSTTVEDPGAFRRRAWESVIQ
ncbi:carboxylesterase/lipase family protein [Prauserella cavernicola]|uniref:Carboxylic ester hydrolase n=1 Tax=Prauserella cavernicola TaxID=2800127 RepID=A0A934QX04_9PSEU|nr:carboxylesterase family protein [Prauserella cavernicola]MBK1787099.1 carboxylesterase/lipase family protein [Prauserella cavernicola]